MHFSLFLSFHFLTLYRMMTTTRNRYLLSNRQIEELPVNAPVFEGYLYLKKSDDKWVWRLFRFDGLSLICLSTKKIKPPSSSAINSLLLTTQKDKSSRLLSNLCKETSCYQLPKWTLHLSDISAITILRCNQRKLFIKRKSKTFCIRSIHGQCYIMKARTLDDLEKWIFVLCKFWNLTSSSPDNNTVPQDTRCHGSVSSNHKMNWREGLTHAFLPTEKVLQIQDWLNSIRQNSTSTKSPNQLIRKRALRLKRTESSSMHRNNKRKGCSLTRHNSLSFDFFQDVNTDDLEVDNDYAYSSLTYHTSIRGHSVKLIKNELVTPVCYATK